MSKLAESHMDHPALLYGSRDEFIEEMVPFLKQGIDAGEVVFVAARGDYLPALRDELGERATAVMWADTFEWHPHPSSRLRAFHELITDQLDAGATGFRFAGEPVWPENFPEMTKEWQRYESVLNAVLKPYPVTLVCLYDTASLDPLVVETARKTHPTVLTSGTKVASATFKDPEDFLPFWKHDLSPAPTDAALITNVEDVMAARKFFRAQAEAASLPPDRVMDMCLATNEIATNAFVHATAASVAAWIAQGRFYCEVSDQGPGITQPFAGYLPPPEEGQSGRGLWMARQLVDLMQIDSGPDGSTVRLSMPLS